MFKMKVLNKLLKIRCYYRCYYKSEKNYNTITITYKGFFARSTDYELGVRGSNF